MQQRLRHFASATKARLLQGFFKTGPGEYGEGDRFLGVMVPYIRSVAKEYQDAPLPEVRKLLRSPWHEARLLALLILVRKFEGGNEALRKTIYTLYLKSIRSVNNWDLVDLTAPKIVGPFLEKRFRKPLYRMVRSDDLWERRIAILATFHFIRQDDFEDALQLAEALLDDEEDLMHKAVGWMLREVGKRDEAVLKGFLRKHYRHMPRTMLRYAIERFPEGERQKYLKGNV
jgi:3-methyladenine DNA glycosylase AlkD